MQLWCKSSSMQVMTNTLMHANDSNVLSLFSARGMTVSGQILLRSNEDFVLQAAAITGTRGIPSGAVTVYRQEYAVFNDGIPYPDRLVPDISTPVKSAFTQALWISVSVPDDCPAGNASFRVLCRTSAGEFHADVLLRIFQVSLPEPKDGAFDHEYFFDAFSLDAYQNSFALFSKAWEELMTNYAKVMRFLRINCLRVDVSPLLEGISRRTGPSAWQFDFSRVDSFISLFLTHGSFRRIVLAHPLDALTGVHIRGFDENGQLCRFETQSADGKAYAECFLRAIGEHFAEKGWLDCLMLHLADEPHETENWLLFRGEVRRLLPGVPCGEPLDCLDSALALQGQCDVLIPRLEIYEAQPDFFRRRQRAGDKLWCYSCCYPEEPEYLNRFIDRPHRYTRLIPWACYSNGITGYLHWGFNFWGTSPELYGLEPCARFKGDSFFVYPDAEKRTLQLSVRAMESLAGIQEYELLTLAEKKHPEAALALARSAARSFSVFSAEEAVPDSLLPELLSLCENFPGEE